MLVAPDGMVVPVSAAQLKKSVIPDDGQSVRQADAGCSTGKAAGNGA